MFYRDLMVVLGFFLIIIMMFFVNVSHTKYSICKAIESGTDPIIARVIFDRSCEHQFNKIVESRYRDKSDEEEKR